MSEGGVGQSVKRKEDQRFLTGKGHYTDDLKRPGQVYAFILRSPYAHAKINKLDTKAALASPGVLAVFTGKDVAADKLGPIPAGWLVVGKDKKNMVEPPHAALVMDTVRHVGDQVAMVIAETKAQAKDAAAKIDVDYEVLPAVGTIEAATKPGAPQVWAEAPNNVCYDWEIGDAAATAAGFAKADKIVEIDIVNNRLVPAAMEPRAAIGEYEEASGEYTLYTTSQNPHLIRLLMAAFTLHVPEHKLRVVAPDVGGGFGSKIFHYAEELLVTWAAKKVGRPIKWTADRSESFVTDAHGRDHVSKARMALSKDGKFLALEVKTTANLGAYLSTFAPSVPTYLYAPLLAGVYTTAAVHVEVKAVFSHTVPVDAYRGAGRPEATYLLERIVEKAARELGMDRVEIRRKNIITKFPYQTPIAFEYDSGNYAATLDIALEKADWAGFEARRKEAASRGKLRGIGMSTYVEACGLAPSALAGALGARAGLYESATLRVHPTGSVTVFTGTHSHGQGHETTFAQLVSSAFGIPFDNIDVSHGDTSKTAFGMGTYGSRSLAVGGSAIVKAAGKIIEKGRKIAAHLLEAAVDDIEFKDGRFTVKGTDRGKAFAEIAFAAYVPHNYPIETVEPGLEESAFYDPKNFTFPGGCHICEVEIDPETGEVKVIAVSVADDVGTIINPMIVAGQTQGGLAQGIGQALLEGAVYDDEGQLLTASFMYYTMPRAADFPFFNTGNHVTACTHNPLGAKGVGETGAIGVPPAVINAVLDALLPTGVKDITMPATPQKIWNAIQDAKSAKAAE
jgi:aerobic carbon-monoxide dehydrogenase large subunit